MIVIELILIKKVRGAIPLWTTVLHHWCLWKDSFSIHRIFVNTMIFHLIVTLKTYVGKILHIDSITSTHPNMHRQRHVGRYTRVLASMLRLKKGNLGKPFDTENLILSTQFHGRESCLHPFQVSPPTIISAMACRPVALSRVDIRGVLKGNMGTTILEICSHN